MAKAGSSVQAECSRITLSRVVPVVTHIRTTAVSSARPPAAVRISVRTAGRLADNPDLPMRKNEQIVVISQKTNSSTTSSARTRPNIAAANSVISR